MVTLLHASDIHFGKPYVPAAMEALLRFLAAAQPQLLVLSGDLTQRAKIREYEEARRFLQGLGDLPVVVTPGNHDVPLYRVFERLFAPLRNYRRYVSEELDQVLQLPGITVVALDSTAPHRAIVNGRISDVQLRFAAQAFSDAPPGDARILVTHHNFIPAPDLEPQQLLHGYQRHLSALARMRVDLILGGHLHRSFVGSSLDAFPQSAGTHPMVIVHCGTTTSSRGRAREKGENSLNLIQVGTAEIAVSPHLLDQRTREFRPTGVQTYPRTEGREE
jgi:3',5'-cyclic AMP phosphodiesterase CpdA